MKTSFLAGLAALHLLFTPAASAAKPSRELSPGVAVNLIALRSDVPVTFIEIAFIIDGEVRIDNFEASHVRRVAAIHPIPSERRRFTYYDIYWNETLGWFLWEPRVERTGDAVFIWSELQGAIVNR